MKTPAILRGLIFFLGLALLTGCASKLQRADKYLRLGQPSRALPLYKAVYSDQRNSASEPKWHKQEFSYDFSPADAARAQFGIAEAYRELGESTQAAYAYLQFADFCRRHHLELSEEQQRIVTEFAHYHEE